MNDYLTIREASSPDHFDRCPAWLRAAVKVGKIRAEKVNGRLMVIPKSEVERIKKHPITISRKEMFG